MHGRRLAIENCSLDELRAWTQWETTRTGNGIARGVAFGAVAALVVAFVYGLWAGTMAYVGVVWGVVAPIAAGVSGFYFRIDRKGLP
jgi:hypothetical protein